MLKLDAKTIADLPIEELALFVLRDLIQEREWNEYSYGVKYTQSEEFRYAAGIQRIMAEAISWLRAHGMVARDPGQSSPDAIFVTRYGHQAASLSLNEVHSFERIRDDLHPLLISKVRKQFLLGEYEMAVFVAMKAVEIRVRKLGGYSDEVTGDDLVTQAYKPGGPLVVNPSAPTAEVHGTMFLFKGAFAVLRNPSGHREVKFDNVNEAMSAVMVANLLMHILDKAEKARS